jgi:hypothetical protein
MIIHFHDNICPGCEKPLNGTWCFSQTNMKTISEGGHLYNIVQPLGEPSRYFLWLGTMHFGLFITKNSQICVSSLEHPRQSFPEIQFTGTTATDFYELCKSYCENMIFI